MKHAALPLLFTLCAALPAAAQHVYKCPRPYGQVVYQQAPCDDDAGEKMDVRPASGEGGGSYSQNIRKWIALKRESCRLRREAGGEQEMRIGMDKDDAMCLPEWMFETDERSLHTAEGLREVVIYRDSFTGRVRSLHFLDGKLTAVND